MIHENSITVVGTVDQIEEIKQTPSGYKVITFYVTSLTKSKDSGKPIHQRHRIVAWRNIAEQVQERLKEGMDVEISGYLQHRDWEGKNGQKYYTTEIVCNKPFYDSPEDLAACSLMRIQENRVKLVGYVERKTEVKVTGNSRRIVFYVRTQTQIDTANSSKVINQTHRVLAWGKMADKVDQNLNDKDEVMVEGYVHTSTWKDAEGKNCYRTEIIADQSIGKFEVVRPTSLMDLESNEAA
jgi:single-strand DNA-binding protein